MNRITWIVFGCLALLIAGCSKKESGDSSTKHAQPIAKQEVIAKQTETAVATKSAAVTSENDAIYLVRQKIKTDKLYEWNKYDECFAYIIEATTQVNYDVGVHENHQGRCGGDPNTFPIIDRFRVERATGNLMWYKFIDGEYVDYSTMKSVKEDQARRAAALRKPV